MKRKLFIGIIICLFIVGCGVDDKKNREDVKEETIESIIAENNYILVDVRTKEEYRESHVVGAVNIPYDTIDESVSLDKSKTIVVYCQSGKRSNIAYHTLKDLGYEVFDLGSYDSITLEKE